MSSRSSGLGSAYLRLRVYGPFQALRQRHVRFVTSLRETQPLHPAKLRVRLGLRVMATGDQCVIEKSSNGQFGIVPCRALCSESCNLSPPDTRRGGQFSEEVFPERPRVGIIAIEQGVLCGVEFWTFLRTEGILAFPLCHGDTRIEQTELTYRGAGAASRRGCRAWSGDSAPPSTPVNPTHSSSERQKKSLITVCTSRLVASGHLARPYSPVSKLLASGLPPRAASDKPKRVR